MKQILVIVTLLVMVITAFFISLIQPSDAVKKAIITDGQSVKEAKSANHLANSTDLIQIPAVIPRSANIPIQNKKNTKLNIPVISNNPAAQLSNLPQEMQEEIKKLSGRYNRQVKAIEVQPGVFMMPPNKRIGVVSVAVMNEDGNVSTYEY